MTTQYDILTRARELIDAGWVQGFLTVNLDGQRKYCSLGAMCEAEWEFAAQDVSAWDAHHLAQQTLQSVLPDDFVQSRDPDRDIMRFNDCAETSKEDVLAAFDRAIEKSKA